MGLFKEELEEKISKAKKKDEKEVKEEAEKEVEEKFREEAQESMMGFWLEKTDYKKKIEKV